MSEKRESGPLSSVLEVTDLKKHFDVRGGALSRVTGKVHAVDGVSFSIGRGETFGLVGESGSGKSTLGKAILRLIEPDGGSIKVNGTEIVGTSKSQMMQFRQRVQMVFQDPYSSLNPRIRVGKIVSEALEVHGISRGAEAQKRAAKVFDSVGLSRSDMHKFPNEFSGGQRQRIGIARALVLNPDLIIADEAVSALDVSVQAQVLNLLLDLQRELGLSYLFIAHDLSVVAQICDRIAVMYLGKIVEVAPRNELFTNPQHPYTKSLLNSIPVSSPELRNSERNLLAGDIPSPINPPKGCRFHTRCPVSVEQCRSQEPKFYEISSGHRSSCWLHEKELST